jgi:hypothetical protein
VAAHEVKRRPIRVEYGPVRQPTCRSIRDPPGHAGDASSVHLRDRLVLIPGAGRWLAAAADRRGMGYLLGDRVGAGRRRGNAGRRRAVPNLLPWIPRDLSIKGFILGGLVALRFALSVLWRHPDWAWPLKTLSALGTMLILPPITAFITLNFTGTTTFTSRSGVRREIFTYVPAMVWMLGAGIVLNVGSLFIRKVL